MLFRRFIDRGTALPMIAGALPGAFIGSLLPGAMPAWVLQVLLVALTLLAIARALQWLRYDVPRSGLAPAAFVIGGMTGTAGVLYAPALLTMGLTGGTCAGTSRSIAVVTHVGRVVAYASSGFFTRQLLLPIVVAAAAITVGNPLGERAPRAPLGARHHPPRIRRSRDGRGCFARGRRLRESRALTSAGDPPRIEPR